MPTLEALVHDMAGLIEPVGDPPLDATVSAVHVSELLDPTPYLDGGEFLLTTGLAFPDEDEELRAYAARLAAHGIVGLGLGVGPVQRRVPPALADGCATAGLPLFKMWTPFVAVSKAYWSLLSVEDRAAQSAVLGLHQDLARAATRRHPTAEVIRVLARSVGGWAARLDPDGVPLEVWPRGQGRLAGHLRRDVERLRSAGPHAASSFPLGVDQVVVQPLTRRDRLLGFVATGSAGPLDPAARALVVSACVLLSAVLDDALGEARNRQARCQDVAELILLGEERAARLLAAQVLQAALPLRAALVCVAPGEPERIADLVAELMTALGPEPAWVTERDERCYAVVPETSLPRMPRALAALARIDPEVRTAQSPVVALTDLVSRLGPTTAAVDREGMPLRPAVDGDAAGSDLEADAWVSALAAYQRSPLVPTVASWLRHRGSWERVSEELGTHRNTVRARVATAERVLGQPLDEPDLGARLWLALRRAGLA